MGAQGRRGTTGGGVTRGDAEQVYRGNLERLLRRIHEQRGLDMSRYRPQYVERRVATRLRALGLHSYRQYGDYIGRHPEEFDRLIDTLTINVTEFFRDTVVYDLVAREVLPSLVSEKLAVRQRMIRVWSAGCATGEEPYSVAMALLEALGGDAHRMKISILATDLDETALAKARAATYPLDRLKNIPKPLQVKYLDIDADTFHIRPEVTRLVKFRKLNLFSDKPLSVVDLILCRNVFIYFNREQQELALESFWSALVRGGHLVLGRSEKMSTAMARKFELVSGRERVYRKPKSG